MYSLGLDIGTTSICAVILDSQTGEAIKTITKKNDTSVETDNSWESLQDSNKIYLICENLYTTLLTMYPSIAAIGVTGQMHGVLYVDADGNAVSSLYIWQDRRGELPYPMSKITYAQHLSNITETELSTGYGAVTHFYNVCNNIVPKYAVTLCTIADYVVSRLTSTYKTIIHPTNAASIGLYDIKNHSFDSLALESAGMDISVFPEVVEDFCIIGRTKHNIPVSVAIGDNQASVFGSIHDYESQILINIGTGAQLSVVSSVPVSAEGIDCRPYFENKYLLVGSSLCGGYAYAVLENFFCSVTEMMTGIKTSSLYEQMELCLNNIETTSKDKLIVNTQFNGTRKNPEKRGSISNINTQNITPRNLIEGTLNGIAQELYQHYEMILPKLEHSRCELIGSGNGVRKNAALQRILKEKFNLPVIVAHNCEEASCGAALLALISIGCFQNMKKAQQIIRYQS